MLHWLLACDAEAPPNWSRPSDAPPVDTETTPTPADDTGAVTTLADTSTDTSDTGEPAEAFDVVVVGSGPAGMAAALTAREAGASVLVLERDDYPGLGLILGGLAFATGSRWQAELGIVDTPEGAAAAWESITGVSGDHPGVRAFLDESGPTLEWLADNYGLTVEQVGGEIDVGWIARLHTLNWGQVDEFHPLIVAFDGELRTSVEVTEPWIEDGAIVGVRWVDLATGLEGRSRAGAVVIATGGFLRDLDRARAADPRLEGRDVVFENNPQANGGGLPFLAAVGAAMADEDDFVAYVHSIPDPDSTEEGLLVVGFEDGLVVGEDGGRFVADEVIESMDLFDALPPGDVFVVLTEEQALALGFSRPGYRWAAPTAPESVDAAHVLSVSPDIWSAPSLADLAAATGIDAEGLQAEVDGYNAAIAAGSGDPWGRPVRGLAPFESDVWYAVRLVPGLGKNFGGVATDTSGAVLDADGLPIPGLFAAGEVAGMIVGGGGGEGFSGSVAACYQGGRAAGASAVAYAAVE
ncbi:MAG: FAD-binding protein [Myxococcota bacterium]